MLLDAALPHEQKSNDDDDPRCGAKNRQGKPCRRRPTPGSIRCNLHGGKSLRGAAHPNYKTGRYSKHLPARVAADFEAALADPDLVSHRRHIAILDVRWTELLKRLHSGESGSLWSVLLLSWSAFERHSKQSAEARRDGDEDAAMRATVKAQDALQSLGRTIHAGAKDELAWEELIDVGDKQSQIIVREQGRLRDLHQMMTAEEVLLLMDAMHEGVARIVKDRSMLAAIGVEMSRLLNIKGRNEGREERDERAPVAANNTVDSVAVEVEAAASVIADAVESISTPPEDASDERSS